MSLESIISQRLIRGHVIFNDLRPVTVSINKPLVLSVKSDNMEDSYGRKEVTARKM